MTEKDHDGHDHDTTISCFANSENKEEHIHIEFFRDGLVRFGEYKSPDELQKVKEHVKKKGIKDGGIYSWKTMSYGAFVEYLQNQKKLKATTEHILIPNAHHDLHGDHHHEHDPHVHGSFWSRVMKMQNPASIWKGFEMIIHGIEHTLEKGAKLDAARFAMGTSRFLHLPDTVSAQIYSDIVNNSKEIIEKYRDKIFGLPGPRGREKVLHIVENVDSRPEEVIAAVTYMMKSYGHLYSEDIKHKQTIVHSKEQFVKAKPHTYLFFDALVHSTKVGNLHQWREKAYEKAVSEMGSEEDHEGEPTEEQLIHAFCKMVDGDWDKFPYAASVVKAMGGPSGYEKMWKFEGFEDAYKKGKDQTGMVNAQGRLNKAVSYLGTHEIYKAIGAMEQVAAKVKAPEYQAMPFIWAVGGFSRYASHTALQKLKGYSENGFTFHAYSFLRNAHDNEVYQKTVRMALEHIGGASLVNEFDSIRARLEFDSHNPKSTKGAALEMMKFWQKHQSSGLHDMLQGQNGWLLKKQREGNAAANDYMKILLGKHSMLLKDDSIPGVDFGQDWFKEHGFESIIFSQGDDGLRSLSSMLNKIKFEGTSQLGGREMKDELKQKVWQYVCKYMDGPLRDTKMFLGDKKLQKEQYLSHRREILRYFAKQMNTRVPLETEEARKRMIQNINTYEYYGDLRRLGITPESVFSLETEKATEELDYQRWITGTSSIANTAKVIDIQDYFKERTHASTLAEAPLHDSFSAANDDDNDSVHGIADTETHHLGGMAA